MSDTRRDPKRIAVETMAGIISEFAELNPSGKVVICGGEPMLEYERYIGVCQAARSHGLKIFNATNGYGVHSDDRAADLLLRGPHELTLSLDSSIPEEHDKIRGRQGSYDTVVLAVQRLVAARTRLGLKESRINVMVLLTSVTYNKLRQLYQLVLRELGANKLKVNGLQPSFGVHSGKTPPDDFFASYSQVDVEKMREELNYCNLEFKLHLNPLWISQFCRYYADLQGRDNLNRGWSGAPRTSEHICNCYERNLVVGLYGEIGHCYSFSNFAPVKYQVRGDLKRFWDANEQRSAMVSCNRLCAIGHSNRNLSATLCAASE